METDSQHATGEHSVDRIVRLFNAVSGQRYTTEDFKWGIDNGDRILLYFKRGFEAAEQLARAELRGHPDSELWGENGLIAATMRCVEAVQSSEPND